jgi:dTDP-4-amino-4,6-dideoxygalactose transaminase
MTLNGQTKDAFTKSKAGGWRYDIVDLGMKINMPDVLAAIGLAQIKKYDTQLLQERKRIFNQYSQLFSTFAWAKLPPQDTESVQSSYHLYALRINHITEAQRDLMIDHIAKEGVAVNVHFIPMPMLTLFKNLGYKMEDYPTTYANFACEISLPIYPQLTTEQVNYIVDSIHNAYQQVIAS